MPKVINHATENADSLVKEGMFFKSEYGATCMIVRADGGLYLIDLSDGVEWTDENFADTCVQKLCEENAMTLLNVQSITIQ